jgi:NADPH:quinone reductase-like Zn-dependent oxidoreductase
MRAVMYDRWGAPLVVGERPLPEPPPGRVRVRVDCAALNPKDVLVHSGRFAWVTGRRFPRTPGHDYAGVVDALGPGVSWTRVGEPVWGFTGGWPGGTLAEQVVVSRQELGRRPRSGSAADVCGLPLVGCTALQGLRDQARLRPGERVLVHGASGGLGTTVLQVVRALGGVPTAVCSAANADLVAELGAERVLAYDRGELAASSERWDVVFDAFGTLPYAAARRWIGPGGRHLAVVIRADALLPGLAGRLGLLPAHLVTVRPRAADLDQLAAWVEGGQLRPVVDRILPLAAAGEGFTRLRSKRTRGKVVIRVAEGA